MYQALYRKYRPRCFSDVVGQDHVTKTLRHQISGDRLSHAYLFVGTRGTGKTTCAKILSRAVNCMSPSDGEPCNKCTACIGIENGSILDVLELDAASNNGVDNVRALREEAIYTPATTKKRVYIVDEVHMLSTAAFNALLKILEEPPEHLIFVLATTELHKVPATILSRCQRFSFKRVQAAAISERLAIVAKTEGITLTADAAEKLAALADGSMRDGLSLFDQCAVDTVVDMTRVLDMIGLAGQQELLRLAGAIADRDTSNALGILDGLHSDGRDLASLLGELSALMRDLLIFKLSANSPLLGGGFSRDELFSLSKRLSPERLFSLLNILSEALLSLSRGGCTKLSAEMCLIRMCDERLSDDTPAILARIAHLEECNTGSNETAVLSQAPQDSEPPPVLSQVPQDIEPPLGLSQAPRDIEPSPVLSKAPQDSEPPPVLSQAPQDSEPPPALSQVPQDVEPHLGLSQAPQDAEPPPVLSQAPQDIEPSPVSTWHSILELLRDDIPVYALLSDDSRVKVEVKDAMLIVRTGDIFTANTVESKMFTVPLGEAAASVLGREVVVRVETATDDIVEECKIEKLDRLSAFDIVKFE